MKNILIVDDDADYRELEKLILEPHYEVRQAGSPPECFEALKARKPDLILLDVMMNHLSDGLDMTRELKSNPDFKDIPVIMVTSVNEVYDYRQQVEFSYYPHAGWIDKPVKKQVLLDMVARVLENHNK